MTSTHTAARTVRSAPSTGPVMPVLVAAAAALAFAVSPAGLDVLGADPSPSVGPRAVTVTHEPAVTTAFDSSAPEVANLDPALRAAVRRAATDAAADDVTFVVNSGWRSPEHQAQLLRKAVGTHGSEEEAARWVATPKTSPHVSGDAVDLGGAGVTAWLTSHGSRYGLCQIYRNEPWHYELRPGAATHGCPAMYADPTKDPRMQR